MTKTNKPKRINQGDNLRTFGAPICNFYVGESALSPGQVQICQYSASLVGPLTTAQIRALAAQLVAAADALEADAAAQADLPYIAGMAP